MSFSCFVLVYVQIDLYSCKTVCQQSLFCILDRIKVAYYSFQWRKSALFQSFQKRQKRFSFGLFITLTVIRNDFHPKKKYERLRTY